MGKTKIEWTEKTWNPVTGCTKVSAGCKNCYAERLTQRFWPDKKFTDVVLHPERINQPLVWKKPSMVFVCSMSDLFHPDIPDDYIAKIIGIMVMSQQHTFQVLTKRPERAREILSQWNSGVLKNVWIGVSVEDQKAADLRIPELLKIDARVKWLSCEPLLALLTIDGLSDLDWVVVGGESGPNARTMNLSWAVSIKNQCREAAVPFFFKQESQCDSGRNYKKWDQFPDELKIREYPAKTQGA